MIVEIILIASALIAAGMVAYCLWFYKQWRKFYRGEK